MNYHDAVVSILRANCIFITGYVASGKSTASEKLGKLKKIKVFHLDKYRYKSYGIYYLRTQKIHNLMCRKPCIIEGAVKAYLTSLLVPADVVIFSNADPAETFERFVRQFENKEKRIGIKNPKQFSPETIKDGIEKQETVRLKIKRFCEDSLIPYVEVNNFGEWDKLLTLCAYMKTKKESSKLKFNLLK
jgi:adenylate kinase family enzyme